MSYTVADILALHRKYAPSDDAYELVVTHCQIVSEIALQLISRNNFEVDQEVVQSGALLHDIGVYQLCGPDGKLLKDVNYLTHGIEGEKLLKREGLPEQYWRFASHHIGVGLSKADVVSQGLPLPVADYFTESDEELLVMYADKFHSKTLPPSFNSYEWYRKDISRFGEDKVSRFDEMAMKFGKPDLQALSQKYGFAIR